MPKVKIDYSNTIFYKILCNDTSVNDLYIGHTTNFVQRKYAHKQGCINPKSVNYNCKLYNVIRDNMGWDNWTMEIIAFHNCEDLMAAKKQEQQYFEEYKATLNSIEPSPTRKPKREVVARAKREVLYCNTCKVFFDTRKAQAEHNKRPRHLNLEHEQANTSEEIPRKPDKFSCEKCDFSCNKKSNYESHLTTEKHNKIYRDTSKMPMYSCDKCGQEYKYHSGLWRHKQTCNNVNHKDTPNSSEEPQQDDKTLILELLKQNKELHEMVIELVKNVRTSN